ncbi:homeodomain-like DNA binding domain-containing transcription factor [Rhizophagus irregularis DAOM 181602=DAOM 197198]|nr:homeodomain-like DNA binding domain-containing transcription factor [Rhizophagus irregularis DAOM 181602=DAOM 197198]
MKKFSERQYIFGVPQVDWKYHTRPSQYKPPPRPGREVSKSSTSDDEKSPDPAEFVHKKAQVKFPKYGEIRNESASAVSNRSMFNTPITIASREQEHRSRWLAGLRQQQQKIHNQRIKKLGPKSILPSEKKPRHLRISGLSYLEARPPPTVYMPDDDDESSIKNVMMSVGRLQDNDIQQMCNFITGPVHYGFCCDGCHMDPIIGTRYLFNECDESLEVVLCEECFVEGSFENEYH